VSTLTTMIRDAAYARLIRITEWRTTRKTPLSPLQPGDVPALGVFLLRETYQPDGDANAGPPRYIVDAVISVAILDIAGKPEVIEGSVDRLVDQALDALLCDGTFLGLRDGRDRPIIDSVPAIQRSYHFPQMGESYYLECRLQMTFRFMCFFEANAPYTLHTIDIDTRPMDGTATSSDILEITTASPSCK
jgi:hypothetical protein